MDILILGLQDPKISITDCPLKREVDILFSLKTKLSGEMLYCEGFGVLCQSRGDL